MNEKKEENIENLNDICLRLCSNFFKCVEFAAENKEDYVTVTPWEERESVKELAEDLAVVLELLIPIPSPPPIPKWIIRYRTFNAETRVAGEDILDWTCEAESVAEATTKFKVEHKPSSMSEGYLIEEVYKL